MSRVKKLRVVVSGAIVAAASLGSLALPAHAQSIACGSGKSCFWPDSNRNGNWTFTPLGNATGPYNDVASSFEDKTSGNRIWRWDNGCGGNTAMILSPGAWQNASWWNNDETSCVQAG